MNARVRCDAYIVFAFSQMQLIHTHFHLRRMDLSTPPPIVAGSGINLVAGYDCPVWAFVFKKKGKVVRRVYYRTRSLREGGGSPCWADQNHQAPDSGAHGLTLVPGTHLVDHLPVHPPLLQSITYFGAGYRHAHFTQVWLGQVQVFTSLKVEGYRRQPVRLWFWTAEVVAFFSVSEEQRLPANSQKKNSHRGRGIGCISCRGGRGSMSASCTDQTNHYFHGDSARTVLTLSFLPTFRVGSADQTQPTLPHRLHSQRR